MYICTGRGEHTDVETGWLPMNTSAPDGGLMLRFGADGKAVQNVTGADVEAVCFGKGPYNPFP
jgi:acetylcholinesterase